MHLDSSCSPLILSVSSASLLWLHFLSVYFGFGLRKSYTVCVLHTNANVYANTSKPSSKLHRAMKSWSNHICTAAIFLWHLGQDGQCYTAGCWFWVASRINENNLINCYLLGPPNLSATKRQTFDNPLASIRQQQLMLAFNHFLANITVCQSNWAWCQKKMATMWKMDLGCLHSSSLFKS